MKETLEHSFLITNTNKEGYEDHINIKEDQHLHKLDGNRSVITIKLRGSHRIVHNINTNLLYTSSRSYHLNTQQMITEYNLFLLFADIILS